MKILCVDDDEIFREIYRVGLEENLPDAEIFIAASGEEAMELIDDGDFDVVLTDLQMGETSGLDVLRHVKRISLTAEVIIVTGVPSIDTVIESMKLGARDYIEKPLSIPLLIEKLERIRSYRRKVAEAERYRLEKESMEMAAGLKIHQLEYLAQEIKTSITEVCLKLSAAGPEVSRRSVQQLLAPLKPFASQ